MNLAAAGYDGETPRCAISPHAVRINFETQQIMAINLVESLIEQGVIAEGSHIAIIGGGLSGVTAAASLLKKGFEVTIIEQQAIYFQKQRNSSHRFIHPSVSYWPVEPLRYTTNLPLLNWHADTCDRVIEQIAAEWEQITAEHAEMFHAKLGVKYLNMRNEKNHKRPEKCEFDIDVAYPPDVQTRTLYEFNFLIDCTGFAAEGTIDGVPSTSYWEFRNPTGSEIVICGSGDGGLIEAIMHVFDIRMERIIEIAHILDNLSIKQEIKDALEAKEIDRFVKANTDKFRGYFPKPAKHAKLITQMKDVYTQDTAPIHRMLISMAEQSDFLDIYRDCTLEAIKKSPKRRINTVSARRNSIKRFRIKNLSNKKSENLPESNQIVVRIGPQWTGKNRKDETKKRREKAGVEYPNTEMSAEKNLKRIREFARMFKRDLGVPDSVKEGDMIPQKAIEAIYRWLDHQRIAKPRSLDVQRCDDHFEIMASPPIRRLPKELFGIAVLEKNDYTTLDDFPYAY